MRFRLRWTAPSALCSGSNGRWPSASRRGRRDEELRAKVREVVAELDELIREAAA